MTLNERFTEEEQFLLSNTPFSLGSSMTFAEGSGLGTVKEMFSSTKSFLAGAKTFSNNDIIVGLLPKLENFSEARKESKAFQEAYKEWILKHEVKSYEDMENLVITDMKKVSEILKEKATPEEATEYKEWAMSIAESVANAAKEGGFLGFGGERISEKEKELYAKVADVLEVSATLS
jgi:hypothetical protein